MFLKSVFMLNYPPRLTLIQSSLKALIYKKKKIPNTRTNTQPHEYTHCRTTTSPSALSESQQLRNRLVKGVVPASVFKDAPANRFSSGSAVLVSDGGRRQTALHEKPDVLSRSDKRTRNHTFYLFFFFY